MPRRGRVWVPDCPYHIVQRGHNRSAVFIEDQDYLYYLENLEEWKNELSISIYSYCLMTNHIHLIVNPGKYPERIGHLMKRLAGRQTRYVNKLESRTGSLWESRYKISPIETESYLLQCCRYVELNPVKAKMVDRAAEYRWSSYRKRIGLEHKEWLDDDSCYLALASNEARRFERYKEFVEDVEVSSKEQPFICRAVSSNQLTGSLRFIDEVERRTGFRVENRGRGRPVVVEK